MPMPPTAKSQNLKGLEQLRLLGAGQAVHYCMVRLGGKNDKVVYTLLADASGRATKQRFKLAWAGDETVANSAEKDWYVGRGAFTMTNGKITTVPSLRDNRATAGADAKTLLKDARKGLKEAGLVVAPLQLAIGGTFARAADTTSLGLNGAAAEDEVDDESEVEAGKATEIAVLALVKRFQASKLKATLDAYHKAKEEGGAPPTAPLEALKAALGVLATDIGEAEDALKKRTLAKTRFGKSLDKLEELDARVRTAIGTLDRLLTGADLAPASRAKVDDPILQTLRGLAGQLKTAAPERKIALLTDMYFAADMWLKVAGEGVSKRKFSNAIEAGMVQKVQEVYDRTCRELATLANVTINHLPRWLEETQGKGMEHHGTELDVELGLAKWMTGDQRDLFRVHVKGGKLYQYDWWNWEEDVRDYMLHEMELVAADSALYPSEQITAGYTGFVLSMGGDLYITHQHAAVQHDGEQRSVFHSSYMAGLPVLMAGEMLVKGGVVKRVNTGSGHYRPPPAMMVRLLKMLKTQGVEVVEVADNYNENVMPVAEFLAAHGDETPNPDQMRANEVAMATYRQEIFFSKMAHELEDLRGLRRLYARHDADRKRKDVELAGVMPIGDRTKLVAARKLRSDYMGTLVKAMRDELQKVDFGKLAVRLKTMSDKHEKDKARRIQEERDAPLDSGIRRVDVPEGADDGYVKAIAKAIVDAKKLKADVEKVINTFVA